MSTDSVGSATDFGNNNHGTIAHAHIVNVNVVNVNIAIQSNESRSIDAIAEQYKELGAVVVEEINGRLAEGVRSTSSSPHPPQVQATQESLYSNESRSLDAIGEQYKELGASSSPHPPQIQVKQESYFQYRSVQATYGASGWFGSSRQQRHNIIIFGEAGAGKSSVVNMLVGRDVAKTSISGGNPTKRSIPYDFKINDCHFRIFDTAGFNEDEQDQPPSSDALTQLYNLVRELDGVSLLIYCMRAPRMKESSTANWKLFHQVVCKGKVPIIAVVTGLEEYEMEMDEWWPRHEDVFRVYGLNPLNVACITTIKGKRGVYEREYNWSKTKLQKIISEYRMETPWHAEKDAWWGDLWRGYQGLFWQGRREEGGLEEPTLEDLVDGCGLDIMEAKKVLEASKSGRKRPVFNFF